MYFYVYLCKYALHIFAKEPHISTKKPSISYLCTPARKPREHGVRAQRAALYVSKRALHLRKRALHLNTAALHLVFYTHTCTNTKRIWLACSTRCSNKQTPYLRDRALHIFAKEPHIFTKEPYFSTKEPYIFTKEPYITHLRGEDVSRGRRATLTNLPHPISPQEKLHTLRKRALSRLKSPTSPAKHNCVFYTHTCANTKRMWLARSACCSDKSTQPAAAASAREFAPAAGSMACV